MNNYFITFIGLAIPFLGTLLGAAMVFFLKNEIKQSTQRLLLGFASGVMIAASVWSLLIPSIEMSEKSKMPAWFPAAVGFMLGIAFLLLLDTVIPHLHINTDKPEGKKSSLTNSIMLILAVTLHNIPEGMAVGVVFAGLLTGEQSVSLSGALALSIGIAVQNFPEGAVISMPLIATGISKKKAFGYGVMSGIVEPVGAVLTIILTSAISSILPYILSFAAGTMIYVVIEELIPEAQSSENHSNVGTVGAAFGFVLMMVLDVALG